MRIKVSHKLMPPSHVIKRLGVDERGKVQAFATGRILFHMRRFMPWLTGQTATGLTQAATPTSIVVNAPYARYLYMDSKMRDPNGGGPFPIKDEAGNVVTFRYRKGSHPVATGVPLSYTHTVNSSAGGHWDRTLVQEDGAQIAQEITDYARRMH